MNRVLYDYPEYYEVAFSFRDFAREADFLQSCIKQFSTIPVRRIFEVACGPAPHAEELTRRGYAYTGLDINRNMLDHAQYKWRHLSPRPELIEGDMISFEHAMTVDFAYVMLGSLYLNNPDEMNRHFDTMAGILNEGGLYFLDWCIQFSDPLKYEGSDSFTVERDGIAVDSKFDIRLVDQDRQMYEEIWTVNVNDHSRHRRFEMVERNKAIFPPEFVEFLSRRSDFEFVGWWKNWNLNLPIDDFTNVTRPVVLLRRVAG